MAGAGNEVGSGNTGAAARAGQETRIVMVMPYLNYPAQARERGFRICAIWDPKAAAGIFGDGAGQFLADLAEVVDQVRLVDFADHGAFLAELRAAVADYRPHYLYHAGSEDTMLATYRLAEELGLAAVNPIESIRLLNDKLELRRTLAAHGISPVRFASADRWQDVGRLLGDFSLPVVVKPTSLSGSRAVMLIHHADQLAAWGASLETYGYNGPVLVEEYLDGPEVSVETISVRGRHHVIGVTRKLLGEPPWFVEVGHVHPEPDQMVTAAVSDLVVRMLTAVGYRTGPAHSEVRLTARGPRIVESQARPGGDMIPRLVGLARGFDVAGGIFDALAGNPLKPGTRDDTARIHYFQLPVGTVTSVTGLAEVRALDFVQQVHFPFRPGDEIPVTVDWRTRHGYVIIRGASLEETDKFVQQVESVLRVEVRARVPEEGGEG